MKQLVLLSGLLFISLALSAQQDYRVIFDLTSGDTLNQKTVLRQARGVATGNPEARVQVVIYSDALDFVTKGKSINEQAVSELVKKDNIRFTVCAATMKRHNVQASQLIPGVEIVPDAVYELVAKQREGWGYIKIAR